MTKHGGENVLQEREDVLVGLEQTPHGLQLHHLRIRPLCNWEIKYSTSQTLHRCLLYSEILGASATHTVAYFFHYEGVEADLVDALVQTVGLVDLLHLFVEHHLLGVGQLGTQDPVVELL